MLKPIYYISRKTMIKVIKNIHSSFDNILNKVFFYYIRSCAVLRLLPYLLRKPSATFIKTFSNLVKKNIPRFAVVSAYFASYDFVQRSHYVICHWHNVLHSIVVDDIHYVFNVNYAENSSTFRSRINGGPGEGVVS